MDTQSMHGILGTLWDSDDNRAEFDEGWTQGRSAFGGLATSFAVTAMRKQLSAPQPMRSLMVSFIAPIPAGEIEASSRILRQGKNVTQLSADVIIDGQVGLQAMGVFGNARESLVVPPVAPFDPLPRESGIPFSMGAHRLPAFLQNFDGYWLDGARPFSGDPQRHLAMWVRHREDMSDFPVERIVALADIPPPVILSYFDAPPVPASSLSWSLEFLVPPKDITSEWMYLEFDMEAAADGYTQQSGRLFDETGRLCALSRQCMVYFG